MKGTNHWGSEAAASASAPYALFSEFAARTFRNGSGWKTASACTAATTGTTSPY
jgi:hypothetical protein